MTGTPTFALPDLETLGPRIIVLGTSNAGKSTLALALSRKLQRQVVFLDLLRHLPDTDWELRDLASFERLHLHALEGESWIIEGNYSALLPMRLTRATGIILLDCNVVRRFARYLHRTLISHRTRAGGLTGGKDSLKWDMVGMILLKTPGKARRYSRMLRPTGLPMVECRTARQLDLLYRAWGLDR